MPVPTISGGTFTFSDTGYNPPSWTGGSYDLSSVKLNEIYTDKRYVFAALEVGLDIIDIESESKCAYITYTDGANTVWGNNSIVFFGTTSSGVKYINKSDISCNITSPVDLTSYVKQFKYTPFITSNTIKHIHGRDDIVMCCTTSGVDVYKLEPNGYRSSTTVSGAYKCFVPAGRSAYYLTSSGTDYFINKINITLLDWSEPDEVFTTDVGLKVNDLFVTGHTAVGGTKNTLFIATSSGVYVIDEATYETDIYYTAV
jgi:hypothetical protein